MVSRTPSWSIRLRMVSNALSMTSDFSCESARGLKPRLNATPPLEMLATASRIGFRHQIEEGGSLIAGLELATMLPVASTETSS